jgi:PAS domain S-box-containing protein
MNTPRILIVDDDANLRKTLCDILSVKGYEPLPAESGQAALERAEDAAPAVALIDLRLGDLSGLDVMEHLKRRFADIECILLTGYASQASAIKAINLGAYGYLQKPYDIEQLLVTIRRALEKQEAREALRRSEANYRTIFNAVSDAIFVLDVHTGAILKVNQRMCDMYGYSQEEVRGLSLVELSATTPPLPSEAIVQGIKNACEEGPQLFEWQAKAKDGRVFWVEVSLERTIIEDQNRVLAVVRDVTRRKQAEEAQRASEDASRAKSEFLANMSHELRTPLNAILGFAQILSASDNLTDHQASRLQTIERSGMHLLRLINDILDLARIEAGRLELQVDDVGLPEFLRGIVDMMRVNAERKGLALRYEWTTELPDGIRADEKRLQEILLNLIGNAIKFTEQGAVTFRVEVCSNRSIGASAPTAKAATTKLRFEVEDTGPGIAPEQLEAIFLPFEQAGARTGSVEGTGLGLAISQRLVTIMGGQLQVRSTVGKGSVFWFELELPMINEIRAGTARFYRKITGYAGPRRKILVADDNESNRAVLAGMLLPLGFTVIEAENGQECLEKAVHGQPDLILLDLRMPVLDGFGATQQIRTIGSLREVAIIAVSASVFEQTRQRALTIGFNDFLFKPIQRNNLLRLIETYLHVDWIYEDAEPAAVQPADASTATVVLPPEHAARLLTLAERGNVKQVLEQLTRLEELGEQFFPLLNELKALVTRFQVDDLVKKLETMQEIS